jgi:hypothetical protein
MESRREAERGRTHVVLTRFLQDDEVAVLASTMMREQTPSPAIRTA